MENGINLYRKFMEGLLKIRTDCRIVSIKSDRGWPQVEIYAKFNQFYNSLNGEQKQILGDILQEARDCAIFDTLEYLDEKINLDNLHITQDDVEFPNDFFGGDFHCDWIALCQGDMWGEDR